MISWKEFQEHNDWIVIDKYVYQVKEVKINELQDGQDYVDIGQSDICYIAQQKLKPISNEQFLQNSQYFTIDEIKNHISESDIWVLIKGNVYNVTSYFDDHPGGGSSFLEVAGRDGSREFENAQHTESAINQMKQFHIGKFCQLKSKQSSKSSFNLINYTFVVLILFLVGGIIFNQMI